MDEDVAQMSHEQLINKVNALRPGIRQHRDSTRHELCWHHPALWGLLPEKTDPVPVVLDWSQFIQGLCEVDELLTRHLFDVFVHTVSPGID